MRDTPGEIVGVGIDLCSVARMGEALQRTPGLLDRLFTPAERTGLREHRAAGGAGWVDSAAAQVFAVKEAVMKSLGVGFDTVPFNAIEVDLRGPSVALHGVGATRATEHGATHFDATLDLVDGPQGVVAVAEVLARSDAPEPSPG